MNKVENRISKFEGRLKSSQLMSEEQMKNVKGGGPLYDLGYWLGTKARELMDWWDGDGE